MNFLQFPNSIKYSFHRNYSRKYGNHILCQWYILIRPHYTHFFSRLFCYLLNCIVVSCISIYAIYSMVYTVCSMYNFLCSMKVSKYYRALLKNIIKSILYSRSHFNLFLLSLFFVGLDSIFFCHLLLNNFFFKDRMFYSPRKLSHFFCQGKTFLYA